MKTYRMMMIMACCVLAAIGANAQQRLTSADQIVTGWYRLKCTAAASSEAAYVGCYWKNAAEEYEQNSSAHYPMLLQDTPTPPAADDATYYVRLVRSGADIQVQSANGHYMEGHAFSTITPTAIAFSYADKGFSIGPGWRNWPSLGNIIGLQSSTAGSYLYDILPVDLDETGLTAWQVQIKNLTEYNSEAFNHTQVDCTAEGLRGLQKVYDKGFVFLPADVKPQAADFSVAEQFPTVTIDEANHVVSVSFEKTDIDVANVAQGYQTTGRGNRDALLLRIDLNRKTAGTKLTGMTFSLKESTRRNIAALTLYQATGTEFHAIGNPTTLATLEPTADEVTLPLDYTPKAGMNYLFLTATISGEAALGEAVDAALSRLTYSLNGAENTIDVPSALGDPSGEMRVFATQSIAYVPTSDDCRYYRIPAMITDADGNIVVAADRRYGSNGDLGGHKIDVSVRRSEDGGRTWSAQTIVAKGDGASKPSYGFGDAALARTQSGRIICVMAAGNTGYWDGLRYAGITTSDDGGKTWSRIRQLYTHNFTDAVNGKRNQLGFFSNFISSGKGLTTSDGTMMFTTNCLTYEDTSSPQCYILSSSDEGESWTLGPTNAYAGCDESKLEQLNDGRLLLSVRQGGARGFNIGSADAATWGTQWTNDQLYGSATNADILYYSRATDGKRDIMLHSYPKSTGRSNLTIAMSLDGGMTWKDFLNIQPGNAAYSTMALLPNGDVGVLYEDGSYDTGNGYAITFVTIAAEQINAFAEATGINQHPATITHHPTAEAIYAPSGLRLQQPQRGLNIVRRADGSTAKIITK